MIQSKLKGYKVRVYAEGLMAAVPPKASQFLD